MLIGMRNGMLAGGWKNPYITDGLVAIWDGICNAGWGAHDPNATVWKDLVGDADFDFSTATGSGSIEVEDNAIVKTDVINPASGAKGCIIADPSSWTIEAAMQFLKGESVNGHSGVGSYPIGLVNNFTTLDFGVMTSSTAVKRIAFYSAIIDNYNNPTAYAKGTFTACQSGFPASASLDDVRKVAFVFKDGKSTTIREGGWSSSTVFPFIVRALNSGRNTKGKQRIFCIRLYNRALTAAEVAANYTVDKARFNLP